MLFPTCTIKIAGPAGTGIKSSGLLLSQILIAHGFNTRDYSEYPSLVRGGHNTYQVSFSQNKIFAPHYYVNLFFSLLPNHWQQHKKEFNKKTLIFGQDAPVSLPLEELSNKAGGQIFSNTICLGITAYLLNLNINVCKKIIISHFGKATPNITAFELGYNYASINYQKYKLITSNSKLVTKPNVYVYDGNESYGWGFIKAGGNFYTAYPMTPATGALHFLADKQIEYKLTVVHPEDEIAAASLAAGASFAGARSATGTSGGGFALMTETVSFCGVANLGVVFYLVSRPGPATGLPTWTAQGDLLFAINSGHGEFPKIVLAPGDQAESFEMSTQALNLAAKFNVPVIVLSDKFIAESGASLSDLSKKKVIIHHSKKPIPGNIGQEYLINSYEHNELGFSIEDAFTVNKMVKKRLSLIKKIISALPKPTVYGSTTAKKLIISWGSTKSPILEALNISKSKNYAYLQIHSLWPINPNLNKLIKPFKEIIVIENNATSQLTTLLKSQFDFNPTHTFLKYNGRPFFPEDIIKILRNL